MNEQSAARKFSNGLDGAARTKYVGRLPLKWQTLIENREMRSQDVRGGFVDPRPDRGHGENSDLIIFK